MFRIWFKLWKDGRIIKDMTITRPEKDTRTHKIFSSLEECCRSFDLEQPLWLDSNIKEFKLHSRTRFNQDSFIESLDFDYMEMQMLDEDE